MCLPHQPRRRCAKRAASEGWGFDYLLAHLTLRRALGGWQRLQPRLRTHHRRRHGRVCCAGVAEVWTHPCLGKVAPYHLLGRVEGGGLASRRHVAQQDTKQRLVVVVVELERVGKLEPPRKPWGHGGARRQE